MDFITEFTPRALAQGDLLEEWILNIDEVSNNKGSRISILLTTPEGTIIEQSYTLGFLATSNEVEYEVIIASLRMATTLGVLRLEVRWIHYWW